MLTEIWIDVAGSNGVYQVSNIFPSANEAGRQLHIPSTSIIRNCKGIKTQTCHDYIWKYANEISEVA